MIQKVFVDQGIKLKDKQPAAGFAALVGLRASNAGVIPMEAGVPWRAKPIIACPDWIFE